MHQLDLETIYIDEDIAESSEYELDLHLDDVKHAYEERIDRFEEELTNVNEKLRRKHEVIGEIDVEGDNYLDRSRRWIDTFRDRYRESNPFHEELGEYFTAFQQSWFKRNMLEQLAVEEIEAAQKEIDRYLEEGEMVHIGIYADPETFLYEHDEVAGTVLPQMARETQACIFVGTSEELEAAGEELQERFSERLTEEVEELSEKLGHSQPQQQYESGDRGNADDDDLISLYG